MIKAYQWTNFFRFASLVPYPETTETNDSTYILGGAFTNLKLGDAGLGNPYGESLSCMDHAPSQVPGGELWKHK